MKAITEIDDDTAVILPLNSAERGQLAAHLLTAAGPGNGRTVRTRSVRGGGRAFVVPLAVAYAAGLIPTEVHDTPLEVTSFPVDAADETTEAEQPGVELDTVAEATDLGDDQAESVEQSSDSETPADPKPAPAKKAHTKRAPAKKAAPKTQEAKTDVE